MQIKPQWVREGYGGEGVGGGGVPHDYFKFSQCKVNVMIAKPTQLVDINNKERPTHMVETTLTLVFCAVVIFLSSKSDTVGYCSLA